MSQAPAQRTLSKFSWRPETPFEFAALMATVAAVVLGTSTALSKIFPDQNTHQTAPVVQKAIKWASSASPFDGGAPVAAQEPIDDEPEPRDPVTQFAPAVTPEESEPDSQAEIAAGWFKKALTGKDDQGEPIHPAERFSALLHATFEVGGFFEQPIAITARNMGTTPEELQRVALETAPAYAQMQANNLINSPTTDANTNIMAYGQSLNATASIWNKITGQSATALYANAQQAEKIAAITYTMQTTALNEMNGLMTAIEQDAPFSEGRFREYYRYLSGPEVPAGIQVSAQQLCHLAQQKTPTQPDGLKINFRCE